MTDLQGLLERVEKASGPDREVDLLIVELFPESPAADIVVGRVRRWIDARQPHQYSANAFNAGQLPYTASLDAALALVERVLPGSVSDVLHEARAAVGRKHALHIRFWKPDVDGPYAAALARAVLAALLKALIAGHHGSDVSTCDQSVPSQSGGELLWRNPAPCAEPVRSATGAWVELNSDGREG